MGTVCVAVGAAAPVHAAAAKPDLNRATAYLTSSTRLVHGHFYESFPGFADFGLTIDGALALASAGGSNAALKRIVTFFAGNGHDAGGQSVNSWTGIGTGDVSGGSLGKEALLAEVTGYDPASFGGQNLIRALDGSVCTAVIADVCAAPGNYRYATSVFAQALAVTAQLRAHHTAQAALPIRYLESLQNGAGAARSAGAWPSLIPGTGADVDSTAMAVMALNLVSGAKATASVRAGLAWLAAQQSKIGGFPGVEANSTNSTGLAVQALSLRGSTYAAHIAAARRYLATRQNSDGGFDVSATTGGSDVRASTQAVSGAIGISFATLTRNVAGHAVPAPSSRPPASTPAPSPTTSRTTSPKTTAPQTTPPQSTPPQSTPPSTTKQSTALHTTTLPTTTTSRTTAPMREKAARTAMSSRPTVRRPGSASTTTRPARSSDLANPSTPSHARATHSTGRYGAYRAGSTVVTTAGNTSRNASVPSAGDPAQATLPAAVAATALANTGTHTAALTELAAALTGLGALLTFAGRRRRPIVQRRPAVRRRHR